MKKLFLSSLLLTLLLGLGACRCACVCEKNRGCKLMTARDPLNAVIERRIYCSQLDYDYNTDPALRDSVLRFRAQFSNPSIRVEEYDSIYHYESINSIRCRDTDAFEERGFGCACAK